MWVFSGSCDKVLMLRVRKKHKEKHTKRDATGRVSIHVCDKHCGCDLGQKWQEQSLFPCTSHKQSAGNVNPCALCLLENIIQLLLDGADGNRRRPMVDRATLARPHIHGGLNCPLVKDIGDSRRVALWTRALYSTEDWACALKKRVLDETGVNGTAFLHKRIPCTNHAHQIIAAFKRLRWAYPDDALTDSRSMNDSSQEQATSSIVVMKGLRQNQHCLHDTQMDC